MIENLIAELAEWIWWVAAGVFAMSIFFAGLFIAIVFPEVLKDFGGPDV